MTARGRHHRRGLDAAWHTITVNLRELHQLFTTTVILFFIV